MVYAASIVLNSASNSSIRWAISAVAATGAAGATGVAAGATAAGSAGGGVGVGGVVGLTGVNPLSVSNSSSVMIAEGATGTCPTAGAVTSGVALDSGASAPLTASPGATAPRITPGAASPIAPNTRLANESTPISRTIVLSIPRSVAMPSAASVRAPSAPAIAVPWTILPRRDLTLPSRALSKPPWINLVVNALPKAPTEPWYRAAVSAALSSVIKRASFGEYPRVTKLRKYSDFLFNSSSDMLLT